MTRKHKEMDLNIVLSPFLNIIGTDLQVEPVWQLTSNEKSYLFDIFHRFGPGHLVISLETVESGSVTAFTHNLLIPISLTPI